MTNTRIVLAGLVAILFWNCSKPAPPERSPAPTPQVAVNPNGPGGVPPTTPITVDVGNATPPPPPPPGTLLFRTNKRIYARDESILIEYGGLPGNERDWITVVKAAAEDTAYNEWYYLQKKQDGMMPFRNPGPGTYEARLYFDWPRGGFKVENRAGFVVQ